MIAASLPPITPGIAENFKSISEGLQIISGGNIQKYAKYRDDPVGFGRDILGHEYPPDVQKLMESVRDNQITIGISATGTGKTFSMADIAVWFYFCFPNCKVFSAAAPPLTNLKNLLWGHIGATVAKNPDLFKNDNCTTLHIKRTDDEFLTGVTIPAKGTDTEREACFSGKHAPNMLFLLDEGDAIPSPCYNGIGGCMSSDNDKMVISFNPRHASGPVYQMIRDGLANVVRLTAFNHPNVVTGENKIPGAVSRSKTVERINIMCRPLNGRETPGLGCFELPDFLVGATSPTAHKPYPPLQPGYYKIMEPMFSYKVLGEYPTQSHAQLISREWIEAARQRWDDYVAANGEIPPMNQYAVCGLDVGEMGTDSSVQLFRYGDFVSNDIDFWQGVDPLVTARRAVENCNARRVRHTNVDGNGVGAGVAPIMVTAGVSATSVKTQCSPTQTSAEMGEFNKLRDQLWWMAREWLRESNAMLPPNELLCEELAIPTYIVGDNGKIKIMSKDIMREELGRSPDYADALCLTFFENVEGLTDGWVMD